MINTIENDRFKTAIPFPGQLRAHAAVLRTYEDGDYKTVDAEMMFTRREGVTSRAKKFVNEDGEWIYVEVAHEPRGSIQCRSQLYMDVEDARALRDALTAALRRKAIK